ncbi:uncharacterized [Tachysurus ichikawai]
MGQKHFLVPPLVQKIPLKLVTVRMASFGSFHLTQQEVSALLRPSSLNPSLTPEHPTAPPNPSTPHGPLPPQALLSDHCDTQHTVFPALSGHNAAELQNISSDLVNSVTEKHSEIHRRKSIILLRL